MAKKSNKLISEKLLQRIAKDVEDGRIEIEQISEEQFCNYLYTDGLPDPDLLIRTSGEMRISNFLLWQLAYTELYFTDTLWPDFDESSLDAALEYYSSRQRRFGTILPQVSEVG